MPQSINLHNYVICRSNGIESILVALTIYNNIIMSLALIYRPPNVPLNILLDFLSEFLTLNHNSDIPIIILGDFNEDIFDKPDSPLLILMQNNGFSQLVSYPTTDRGTVIDHIYINIPPRTCTNILFDAVDTYYSDHDTVFCTFKF